MAEIKLNLSGHQNDALDAAGFIWPGALHVDLADPDLPDKLVEFLGQYAESGDQVTIAIPGLAALASMVVAVLFGLTGQMPRIQTLVRNGDGSFHPGPAVDLNDLRLRVGRANRKGVIRL